MTTTVEASSTRTAACCVTCDWSSSTRFLLDLSVRVCARQHADRTGRTVTTLTSIVHVLHGDSGAGSAFVASEVTR